MRYINTIFVILFVGLIGLLGYATFVEQAHGPLFVAETIYHTWWFFGLWAFLALLSLIIICHQKLWRRTAIFMLHLSFLVILAGAATTFITSHEGEIHLRREYPTTEYIIKGTGEIKAIPFERMELDSFRIDYYPGTQAPQDFISYISYSDGQKKEAAKISMNNIFQYNGYRFYQSSFDPDQKGTVLSISYDPWGTPLTYLGYCMLAFSMILVLFGKNEEFRSLLRHPLLRKGTLILTLFVMGTPLSTLSARSIPTINKEKAERMARMPIIYNDRVAPLSTLAHDFTQKLYGKSSYKGLCAEQVLYGWLQRPDVWKDEPMLKIKDAKLRQQLGIESKYAKLSELFDGEEYKLQHLIERGQESKAVRELDEKVGIILMLTNGSLIRPAKGVELSERKVSAEILYNNLPFAKILFMVNLTLGLLTFLLLMMPRNTVFFVLLRFAKALLWASFLFLLFGYALRWYIGGRIPLGNGYETMLFLALSIILLTILLYRRFVYLIPFGFLLSGFTLLVAWLGEMNPQITPLMPVLKSPLLSTHVSVIMMAYALLAFMILNGIFALIQLKRGHHEQVEQSTLLSRLMLYPAVFLLATGIFLGAVWANVSWGKYWSWDPKEVWALITLLIYAVPFHQQSLPFLRQPKWFHTYLIVAFLTVLMTYFGVNYFLGGMHSYA
ncbi:MAG: cytochrome c biogenesis protein CcsA [Prevotella sp.]|nr:cytochrome c biogenesis protein CcsA [Prevotella sp.]